MGMKATKIFAGWLLVLSAWGLAFASETVSVEAQKYFNRGLTAAEMARSNADYADAVREMEKARQFAPQWPDVYYNLGLLYEKKGDYANAIANFRGYLGLVPAAADAAQVRASIDRLEYLQERNNLTGIWKSDALLSKVSCAPDSYVVADGTMMLGRFIFEDLQLEFTRDPEGEKARVLSSKHRYGALFKDGPFTPVKRDNEQIVIHDARFYTCAADVQANNGPWDAELILRHISADVLEGRISTVGLSRDLDDRGRASKSHVTRCDGQIVIRRSAE